jgi:hypothetical protein
MVLDLVLGQLQFIGDFAPKGKGLCIICMLMVLGFLDQWMYFCPLWILFFFHWNIAAPLAYLNTIFPLQKYTGVSTMCTFQQLPVPAALTLAHFAH